MSNNRITKRRLGTIAGVVLAVGGAFGGGAALSQFPGHADPARPTAGRYY